MSIQVLPPQLANQIAAGEVVERPASVVKELIENSLDAGATRIDIDIEQGGSKLIRIRDNGCGIAKDELTLALARHATSKIHSLDDLEAIVSLGFRGEALASISSVSRLTLTSRTEQQTEAWQAYAEGRDMTVTVKPAAHPVGTTIEVLDLFYNTPARRKFLRTEKTEFTHIDEVVRRIALARFDVTLILQHNGKIVRQYRPATQENQYPRRLAALCGSAFLQHALNVAWQHHDLRIHGWVVDPTGSRQLPDMQYCYVNGRMMRDKLINHAIRQAYQDQLSNDQAPAYVLYLEIDPHQVDVNVHPAKHEVRFHQARMVHDFIYQAVTTVLQQATLALSAESAQKISGTVTRAAAGENQFAQLNAQESVVPPYHLSSVSAPSPSPSTSRYSERSCVADAKEHHRQLTSGYSRSSTQLDPQQRKQNELYGKMLSSAVDKNEKNVPSLVKQHPEPVVAQDSDRHSFGRVLTIYPPHYAVLETQRHLALLALPVAERWLKQAQLLPSTEGLRSQPLLIPVLFVLSDAEQAVIQQQSELLLHMGIELVVEQKKGILRGVPLPLRQQNLQKLIPDMLAYLTKNNQIEPSELAIWLARNMIVEHTDWNIAQAIQLLADLERLCPHLVKNPPSGLLQLMDLQAALAAFTHD